MASYEINFNFILLPITPQSLHHTYPTFPLEKTPPPKKKKKNTTGVGVYLWGDLILLFESHIFSPNYDLIHCWFNSPTRDHDALSVLCQSISIGIGFRGFVFHLGHWFNGICSFLNHTQNILNLQVFKGLGAWWISFIDYSETVLEKQRM